MYLLCPNLNGSLVKTAIEVMVYKTMGVTMYPYNLS